MFNLKAMHRRSMARQFTKEELEMIIEDYKSGMKPYKLAEKYKRNSSSIINKLKRLGVYEFSKNHYSDEDIEFIKREYPIGNWDAIMKRFPNSTKQSIISQAHKLGITAEYFFWNESELEFLKHNYFNYTLDELESHYGYKYSKDAIQTKAFRYFGYSTDDDWSEEENKLLKIHYPTKPIDEVCNLIPARSRNAIISHARILNLFSFFYNQTYWNEEQDNLLLNNWENMSDDELSNLIGKPKLSISERRHRLGLMRVDKDNLKYSDISKYLRGQLQTWKTDSMRNCDYQCVLTGSKNFHIHHLYSFNHIVSDFFNSSNYIIKDFNDYTQKELAEITSAFIDEHNKYPLGVCIRKDIHDLFHSIYGRYNNTQEQWERFEEDYKNGFYINTA